MTDAAALPVPPDQLKGSLLALPTPLGMMFIDPERFIGVVPTKLVNRCGVAVGTVIVEVQMPAEMVAQAVAQARGVGIVVFNAVPGGTTPGGVHVA